MLSAQKVLTAVVTLAALTFSSPTRSEDGNPFANWKQEQPGRGSQNTKEPAKRSGKVEYFSAAVDDKPAAADDATNGRPVQRERLHQRPAAQPQKTRGTVITVSGTGSEERSVKKADFTRSADATVRQTAGRSENPFEELLTEDAAEETVSPSPEFEVPGATNAIPSQQDFSALPPSLHGPQTPAVTLQWNHMEEFTVGQKCACELSVKNSGKALVRDVTVEVSLPKGLQVVAADPPPSAAAQSARWLYEELKPGETRNIRLTVVPTTGGDVNMNAFVQFTGAAASAVTVTEPAVTLKVDGPAAVEVGQQVGYTVHVTNSGTGTARNVVIQAVIPQGLEHKHGQLLTIDIGTLSPGELRRARLNLTAVGGGDHQLAVRVLADGGVEEKTAQLVSIAEPKLNIGLRGPEIARTGVPTEYQLVVVNEGKVDSNNVRAKYRVPEGFEFVRADRGGKYNAPERTIEWFVGTLEPNRVRQYRVVLKPVDAGEGIHQAGVISEHGGVTVADTKTRVEGSARLELQVTTADNQLAAGEDTVFEVKIQNSGHAPASSVGLSCELTPGLELVNVSGPSEFVADNGVIIFRSLPVLEPGKAAVFAVKARCTRAGIHKLRARVASESTAEPLIGETSTRGRE